MQNCNEMIWNDDFKKNIKFLQKKNMKVLQKKYESFEKNKVLKKKKQSFAKKKQSFAKKKLHNNLRDNVGNNDF